MEANFGGRHLLHHHHQHAAAGEVTGAGAGRMESRAEDGASAASSLLPAASSSASARYHSRSAKGAMPSSARARLHGLFREVEKEFEALYLENSRLRDKVARLEKGEGNDLDKEKAFDEPDAFEAMLKSFTKKNALKTRRKFKQHTSKIVSSFRPPVQAASLVKEYRGHRDGIWDIAVSNLGNPLIGTASADKTARIWGVDSGKCLVCYVGHGGSVNAVSFHPSQNLALTASGDGTAHVWKAVTLPEGANSGGMASGLGIIGGAAGGGISSEESAAESSEEDGRMARGEVSGLGLSSGDAAGGTKANVVRQPIVSLTGHQNVVIGCQWLDDELAVTASWDRSANLYNVETGSLLQTLAGHDDELTHVSAHPSMRLVATSSVDTTFRLWDFRETIHSVSVFQGHTEAVTCASFSRSDQIVSGSDDRSVKVWDLRNMRAPVTSIQAPSAVNRLSVSQSGTIAIPHDNRQVVLYDLSGQKILRLPRDSAKSHHRMVTSTCWAPEDASDGWRSRANLFSAGFDRVAFGWWIRPIRDDGGGGVGGGAGGGASGVGGGGAAIPGGPAGGVGAFRMKNDKGRDATF